MWKYSFLIIGLLLAGCRNEKPTSVSVKKDPVKVPSFSQENAYDHIVKQLEFGTRNPGSDGHVLCKDWFVQQFTSYGATVEAQHFKANVYDGSSHDAWNIIAQFNPEKKERVILSAHWDTRFIGEEDGSKDMRDKPIPGADDGASGCGVLLEIGRLIGENAIDLGVDIILWDAEDQGKRGEGNDLTWCLGSQHWAKNKHKDNYRAKFGINLDMIGAKDPSFGKDYFSKKYAGQVVDKVWKLAQNMGYSDAFRDIDTGGLMDDHRIICEMAGIPMLDIINQPETPNRFIPQWHTHDDDISVIDKRSLKIVGQVVTAVIYKVSDGTF